ncbi:MAG TPA: hypothetical protein VJ279_14050 [Hanamia sp.]|nr:hypothetical protein [Hanamia sp.]
MIKILHPEDLQSDAELVEYELVGSGVSFQKVVSDNKEDYQTIPFLLLTLLWHFAY